MAMVSWHHGQKNIIEFQYFPNYLRTQLLHRSLALFIMAQRYDALYKPYQAMGCYHD